MKTVNIEEENLHIFWTTWGIFSEGVTYNIIKTHKKAGLHPLPLFLSLWKIHFCKNHRGRTD